jgi:DnaJ-class molecular chaperone
VVVNHIRYLRHTVKHPALKGYWLIADFETEVSARHSPFRQGEQVKGSANGASAPEKTPLEQCYVLLGVTAASNREEVKAAFRRLAFEVHPDVSDLPKDEAELRFKTLSEAYEFIKTRNNWT